ncbi:MAG: PEGA domain-containing protein [Melioribacteraceae bacterium]|nr:PEGA domain-containing protein [Melioribacteraceae bacterium]
MKKQITIILILLACALTALRMETYGQTTSKMYVVKNSAQFLEGELISKDIRDANGEVCAGVVVVSDLQGLSFQSYNGIVKTNSKPGRHFIFVSPTERVVEIFKSGYEPLKIILNDYGIKLKSGTTWQIKITGDKKLELIPITLLVNQSNIKVYIDDELKPNRTTYQLQEGKHIIRIEKIGYHTKIDTINVSLSNTYFNYNLLQLDEASIMIRSIPIGAKIILDDVDRGETDKSLWTIEGEHTIKLMKSGYSDYEEKINITTNSKREFTFKLVKNSGTLKLNITPLDATVFINREDYSNQSIVELVPNMYRIKISKPNYETISENINIEFGKELIKTYKLVPQTGRLRFSSFPFNAEVELLKDGETIEKWKGSKLLKDIEVGSYTLKCEMDDYETKSETIIIIQGETTVKEIKLDIDKSSSTWYYWVGGALVAGGAAAVAILLGSPETTTDSPIGSTPPGRP